MKDYSFGNYICALRTGLGLSQFQLGTLVGVTDKAVSKWENGDSKPRLSTCHRLAEVFGITINELLSCELPTPEPARKELRNMNRALWKQAYKHLSIYSETPPALCWSRLEAEEAALCGTDAIQSFALLGKLEEEARKIHSVIVPQGPINSSFAAWLFGATKVNPLPPHYRCPKCGKTEFVPDAADGFDLPPKSCTCGEAFLRDGHNIPFEGYAKAQQRGTWIELQVSETFQPVAVDVLHAFYKDIAEILPVRFTDENGPIGFNPYVILSKHSCKPSVSEDGFWYVSALDFHNWWTGETAFVFLLNNNLHAIEHLYKTAEKYFPSLAELTTPRMAELLYQERCKRLPSIIGNLSDKERHDFDLLIRIDGMDHSAGAWNNNNGELLFAEKRACFREIPATREDVWHDIHNALKALDIPDNGLATSIMEQTGTGRFYTRGIPENLKNLLQSLPLPEWYPEYLSKIIYLFPKGHCIALLIKELLLTWCQEEINHIR